MVYKWKVDGLVSVEAQKAGEEMQRIYDKYGELEPARLADESRDKTAVLHSCFEWDDYKAAEKYRHKQASDLIRLISIKEENQSVSTEYRAFVHIQNTYQPLRIVLNDTDKTQELLENALRELRTFKTKYLGLEKLAGVFAEIDLLTDRESA